MNKSKGFSFVAIFLLLFQLVQSSFGFSVVAEPETPSDVDLTDVIKIDSISHETDSISWALAINEPQVENDGVQVKLLFDDNQTHGTIEGSGAKVETNENGYVITSPEGTNAYEYTVTTRI